MNICDKNIVEWQVVFCRSRIKTGIMRFLERDISHCYAMRKSEGGEFWIIVNSLWSYLDCKMEYVQDFPHPRLYAGSSAIILPVKAYITERPRWGLCIFNCVEVVKALLGIRNFWIFTPYQLYLYLRGQHERHERH